MSPIPKDKKPKRDTIKEALDALRAERLTHGGLMPPTVIVHPRDAAELKALLAETKNSPLTVGSGSSVEVREGPLMKAFREQQKVFGGRQVTGVSWDEQHSHDKTELQQQLEDSLWSLANMHTPVFTHEALYQHVGPGHMEDDWYVKRVYPEEVHLLCKCRMILVLARCAYGHDVPFIERCEEPAFPEEAMSRKDIRCGQYHGQRP
jgi:hypothetical protein